ncbi:hypothetical protein D3C77_527980 [compost metagenome]
MQARCAPRCRNHRAGSRPDRRSPAGFCGHRFVTLPALYRSQSIRRLYRRSYWRSWRHSAVPAAPYVHPPHHALAQSQLGWHCGRWPADRYGVGYLPSRRTRRRSPGNRGRWPRYCVLTPPADAGALVAPRRQRWFELMGSAVDWRYERGS